MKDKSVKKVIIKELGDFAVFLGGKAVGKCMVPGLFDPKIPEVIKKKKNW